MLNELQKIIKEMEDELSKAKRNSSFFVNTGNMYGHFKEGGRLLALEKYIPKLTLLLNTENENGGKNEASNGGKPM